MWITLTALIETTDTQLKDNKCYETIPCVLKKWQYSGYTPPSCVYTLHQYYDIKQCRETVKDIRNGNMCLKVSAQLKHFRINNSFSARHYVCVTCDPIRLLAQVTHSFALIPHSFTDSPLVFALTSQSCTSRAAKWMLENWEEDEADTEQPETAHMILNEHVDLLDKHYNMLVRGFSLAGQTFSSSVQVPDTESRETE